MVNDSEFHTPMMQQYSEIKSNYPDCLLFFRLGDFYEFFMDDAKIASEVLDITLTSRDRGKDGRIPMAGVPYHSAENYISKLVKAGYKVAICEQLTDPVAGELVDRKVLRVVTPGTLLDTKALDRKQNNYLAALDIKDKSLFVALCDLSTGDFQVTTLSLDQGFGNALGDLFSKFTVVECILSDQNYNNLPFLADLGKYKDISVFSYSEWISQTRESVKYLREQFRVISLEVFGINEADYLVNSCASLIRYVRSLQSSNFDHLNKINVISQTRHLELSNSTIFNLELFNSIRGNTKNGTFLSVIDQTSTAMGGRLLKKWILNPLLDEDQITKRQNLVKFFMSNRKKAFDVKRELENVNDIERLISRVSTGLGNARDLVSIKNSLQSVVCIKAIIEKLAKNEYLDEICTSINNKISNVIHIIDQCLLDEPQFDLKSGGLIKNGFSLELDSLRDKIDNSVSWLNEFETTEREKTGIPTLKVSYNKVFGYYIEVSKSYINQVPDRFVRKQTLVNAERYITQRLKEEEERVLEAESQINNLEYTLYQNLVKETLKEVLDIQNCCTKIAELDCIVNFANVSYDNDYHPASISRNGNIDIIEGRHPVVEKLVSQDFVGNDVSLGTENNHIIVLTGPNMSGKSVFMRQVALIVLMNQIGCFVPAKSAELPIVDRIFVRSGASDFITSGLSTFMVEMVETAHIINNATSHSLIILDELGRGTSTYDGVSLAWAIIEYLASNSIPGVKTLFATHYHELQELERLYKGVKNHQVLVSRSLKGDLVFTHKVGLGASSHSYGIDVAKIAGIPESIIKRSADLLKEFEKTHATKKDSKKKKASLLEQKIRDVNLDNMSPLDSLNFLSSLKSEL